MGNRIGEILIAIVFPGQGSQSVGMVSHYSDNALVREIFDEASLALGYDLWQVAELGPADKLNQTEYTQPALLTAGVANYRVWLKKNQKKPSYLAGHSLGEYTALVCADSLDLRTAVRIVQARGQTMQQAVVGGEGAMAALLGLSDEKVEEVCREASAQVSNTVSAANYNSPGQVVIAGQKNAVERAIILAKERGAKRAIMLSVSVPSHCSLMKPAAKAFEKILMDIPFKQPKIPVLNNVDVEEHGNTESIRNALVRQLCQPVRWVETVQKLKSLGVKTIIESGPGSVLTSLNKRIAPELASRILEAQETMLEA